MAHFNGSDAADIFIGTDAQDYMHGQSGDDRLEGGAGDDRIEGHGGSDTLIGGLNNDDLGVYIGGVDSLDGGDGDDDLTVRFEPGNDPSEMAAAGAIVRIAAGNGNDLVRLDLYGRTDARIEVDLGDGDDRLTLSGYHTASVSLGAGRDTIYFLYPYSVLVWEGDPFVIADFEPGDQGDRIEWNDFLHVGLINYDHLTNPFVSGHLQLVQDGADAVVRFDLDGAGDVVGFFDYFRLEGVLVSDLTAFNFHGYPPDGGYPAGIVLTGGDGDDSFDGTPGDDRIEGHGAGDTVFAAPGDDTLLGGDGDDRLFGESGHDRIEGEAGADTIAGGYGDDTLLGGDGDDNLYDHFGWDGDADYLDGGAGADRMSGSEGDDVYVVDDAGDVVRESPLAGDDEVRTGLATYTLGEHVERLTGLGEVDQQLIGNARANVLNGGAGADRMEGGDGDDLYVVDVFADQVVELPGQGVDTVRSPFSYVLSAELENLRLSGGGSTDATGNAFANSLTGNNGRNRLDGRAGADTMAGGGGHDVYAVDHAGDRVVEAGSSGVDTVESRISYGLPVHVEKLVLIGSAALVGRGNGGDNALTGNGVSNVLSGGRGDDRIDGGGSHDRIFGGGGNDVLSGGSGGDRFYFNGALGSSNVDRILDFSPSADSLHLDRSVFAGTGPDGALAASAFHSGGTAADAGDRILYDAATGRIFYDADGSGAAAAILFATVAAGTVLSHADFVIYG